MTATPALRVTGLRKSFATPAATATVLDGVDLAVGSGEIVALGGRSGSGKTVLLTVVAGWERPDDGRDRRQHHGVLPHPGPERRHRIRAPAVRRRSGAAYSYDVSRSDE